MSEGTPPGEPTTPETRCVSLSTSVTVHRGIALVTCRIHNQTAVPRAVKLRDELDGPTLPPRRAGVPEAGWGDSSYTTVVDAETTTAVGYASPVGDEQVETEPARIVAVGDPERVVDAENGVPDAENCVSDAENGVGDDDTAGPEGPHSAVRHTRRELDAWEPPRDTVPTPSLASDGGQVERGQVERGRVERGRVERGRVKRSRSESHVSTEQPAVGTDPSRSESTDSLGETDGESSRDTDTGHDRQFTDGTVPTGVTEYLDAAAERIDRAAGTAESVTAATAALRDTHHTPVTLEQAVARDEAALRELAERASELAERAAETDVPVDDLRRFA